ncbi:50S ribosomal protein L35 [bacterium (Candidatus Gribaldobacteria) CG23_combo_of_CG06-09_8_20_14_all_37_87_8]|uniref:50S ribosomal protein L35 n=2 Tax=Candidatus Gribaldobacteria TaxID=2798536 RepID=A0A2G9ZFL4_9BACT|nr:MAG: 50S ribosomal protein L35 [bacterium (Candidatus Gribaldobacteria) CG23_combo_of_CG06-09_8_20_14_all_37_87_8]PIR89868.1 MAG: 50S ribosomal protein L35 [bacterium (Candidatus Gribaldobacteria) CG10_big_fil_rev_8_21_14_0_10_37_21]
MAKPKKALKKRFKITKNGKVLRRATGQDHYRSKKTGKQIRQKRGWVELSKPLSKKIKQLING